jgi:hypothetical protein
MEQNTPNDNLKPSAPDAAPTGALLSKEQAKQLKKREQKADKPFGEFMPGLVRKLAKENEAHQRTRAQARSFIEIQYWGGRASYGAFRQEGGGYKWYPDQNNARLFPLNRFAQVINNLQAQAESSVTKLKVAATTEDEEKKGGAKWGDHFVGDIQERYYTSQFRQRDALFAKFSGESWRYNPWDKNAGAFERVPIPQQGQEQMGGSFMCQCGAEGSEEEASEAGGCPECGQPATMIPGQSVPVTSYQFEKRKTGEPVPVCVDPLEMTKERGRGVPQSRYVIRRRLVHVDDLEEAYEGIDIPTSADVKSPGLQVQRSLDDINPFGSVIAAGTSEGELGDYREYTQAWLQPRTYAKYTFEADCELKCGVTVPKGTRLGDLYPEGMYVALAGDTILDIQSEDGRALWVSYDYYTTTTDGKPVSDAAFLNESIQEAHSIGMDHILRDASGWGGYNKNLFDGDVPPGTPGYYVPMDLPVDGTVKPADVLTQFNGNSLSAHVPAMRQALIEDQQYVIMSFPETAGATSEGGQKTLGGYLSQLEQGTQGQKPMLANRAEADARCAEQWLHLAQKWMTGERGAKLEGQFGQAGWRWFKAADLPSDFKVSFEPDSFMPQTGQQKKARRGAFMEIATPIVQALQVMLPDDPLRPMLMNFLKGTAEDFGLSIEEDLGRQDTRRAQLKLEKFKAACEYVGDGGMTVAPDVIPDPATGQPVPNPQAGQPVPNPEALQAILNLVPYMPEIDGPGAKTQLDFFRSSVMALDDDQEENPLLAAVLVAEMQRLEQADVMHKQKQTAAMIAAQAPAMQAQAAQQQQQASSQAQGEAEGRQHERAVGAEEAAREEARRHSDLQEKEAERSHQSMMQDRQLRHESQLARMKQD